MNNTNLILSDESEKMKNRELLEEYFSRSLEMDLLLRLYPDDEDTLYQIVNLLVDTCATNRKLLHIAGDDKPAEVVRSRFMKLNADHIRFVLKCLAENSSPIRNMKQYLLASLYNAPTTMQFSYYNVDEAFLQTPTASRGNLWDCRAALRKLVSSVYLESDLNLPFGKNGKFLFQLGYTPVVSDMKKIVQKTAALSFPQWALTVLDMDTATLYMVKYDRSH